MLSQSKDNDHDYDTDNNSVNYDYDHTDKGLNCDFLFYNFHKVQYFNVFCKAK